MEPKPARLNRCDGPERAVFKQGSLRTGVWLNGIRVSKKLKDCYIGCTDNSRLPLHVEGLVNTLNDKPGNLSFPVPFIRNEWPYKERFEFLKKIQFATYIDYNKEDNEDKPFIIMMSNNVPFIVRAPSIAKFYNIVSSMQRIQNRRPVYIDNLSTTLLRAIEAKFVEKVQYASVFPMNVIERQQHPSYYLSFDDEEPETLKPVVVQQSDDNGNVRRSEKYPRDHKGMAIVLRSTNINKKLKKDEALYYGLEKTPYFLYIEVLRDNKLFDVIMSYYSLNRNAYDHRLSVVSFKKYVDSVLFVKPVKNSKKGDTTIINNAWRKNKKEFRLSTPSYNAIWQVILSNYYKKEGAKVASTRLLLSALPSFYNLSDPSKISIVVTEDTRKEAERASTSYLEDHEAEKFKNLIGYVTCELLTVPSMPVIPEGYWHNRDLHNFAQKRYTELHEDKKLSSLFHIFHIDGLHVDSDIRNTGLGALLIYYALLFIEETYDELGVTLVTCHAAAEPTRNILQSFGFSFHDERKSIYWIGIMLGEYIDRRDGKRNEAPSLEKIMARFALHKKDYDGVSRYMDLYEGVQKVLNTIAKLIEGGEKKDVDVIDEFLVRVNNMIANIVIQLGKMSAEDREKMRPGQFMDTENFVDSLIMDHVVRSKTDEKLSGMTCFLAIRRHNDVYNDKMASMAKLVKAHGDLESLPKQRVLWKDFTEEEMEQNLKKKSKGEPEQHGLSFSFSLIDSLSG